MLKKLLALSMVVAFGFGLGACDQLPEGLTDVDKLDEAVADLTIATEVSEDIDLPDTSLHGITVTWESANTDLITNEGVVTQPLFSEGNEDVLLTATLTLGIVEYTKDFTVTVLATTELNDQEKLDAAVAALTLPTAVGADMTLPAEGVHGVMITWTSSNEMYIMADGTVMQPAKEDGDMLVTLTAVFEVGDLTFSKPFIVTVTASTEFSDEAKVAAAILEVVVPDSANTDILLKTEASNGVEIEWFSYLVEYLGNDGVVTNPLYTTGDVVVTLIAKYSSGDYEETVNYFITITAATEMNDMEIAEDALSVLLLTVSGNVEANFDLAAQAKGYDIVWSSGDELLLVVNGLVAEVTRPEAGEGNQEVVLTASVTVGEETATKDFTVSIKEKDPALTYPSIADLHASSQLGDIIEFTGIVVGVFDGGYFLSDGTHSLGIYAGGNDLNPAIGDEVKVVGAYAVYNTLYQLGSIQVEEILSSGNANPLDGTAVVKTVAEMLALDTSDALMHGMYYTITGTVEVRGDYGNVYLVDGDDAILIYYYSLEDSLAAVEAELGKEITITIFYYTNHGTNGPMVAYDGGAAGITVNVLPDPEAMAADTAWVQAQLPSVSVSDIVLPTDGVNGVVFTNWQSSDLAVYGHDGVFVARATESTTVTFTVTATVGDLTETIEIDVYVPVASTVEDVLGMSNGDMFEVTGVVYDESYYGAFIHANGYYVFVFSQDFPGEVEVGDEVTIFGTRGEYSGLVQVNIVSYVINSSGNAVVDPVVSTVEAIDNDIVAKGSILTITGTVSIEGTYSNAYLTGVAGGKVEVYYRSNADAVKTFDGQVITLSVTYYQNGKVLFGGVEADITADTTFTDAEKAQATWDGLDLGDIDNVIDDITLPVDNATSGATIAWATTDALVVAADGTVTATAGMNTTATLTATITVGVEVLTKDFVITVIDENLHAPMTVTEASALADGTTVLVKGVVIGKYYDERVIQGTDGAAIWVDSDVSGEIGEEIVVMGTLATYDSYGNNHRQIDDATFVESLSTGNELVMSTETDVPTIFAELGTMQVYTAELTITVLDDGFGSVLFNTVDVDGDQENGFKFKAADFLPTFATDYLVGDVVELTFTAFDFSFNNIRLVNVSVADTPEPDPVPDLFLSEIIEGSSNNKGIEIYNPTGADVDLSIYSIVENYGSGTNTLALTGTLVAGDVYVICTDQVEALSALETECDLALGYPSVSHFNGDDTVQLLKDGVVIDQFHDEAAAGDGNKIFGEHTYVRNAGIVMGTTTFDVSQWTEYDQNDFTHIGSHVAVVPELFISEIIEGSSNNKGIEIYNPTGADVDLSIYSIVENYGSGTNTLALTGTLVAGDVYVICTDQVEALSALETECDLALGYPSVSHFNGDDTVQLLKDGVVIDQFHDEAAAGDGNKIFGEHTYVRNAGIVSGTTTFDVSQWTEYDQNDFTHIGSHTE